MFNSKSLYLKDLPYLTLKEYQMNGDRLSWNIVSLPAMAFSFISLVILAQTFVMPDIMIEDGLGVMWGGDPLLPHKVVAFLVAAYSLYRLMSMRICVVFDDKQGKLRYRSGLSAWEEFDYDDLEIEAFHYYPFSWLKVHALWAWVPGGMRMVFTSYKNDEYFIMVKLDLARRIKRMTAKDLRDLYAPKGKDKEPDFVTQGSDNLGHRG